jgi:hypothetical protein
MIVIGSGNSVASLPWRTGVERLLGLPETTETTYAGNWPVRIALVTSVAHGIRAAMAMGCPPRSEGRSEPCAQEETAAAGAVFDADCRNVVYKKE